MPESSDYQLILEARAGDESAFRKLVEKYARFSHALACKLVRNTDDAEDIAQEAFIRLWKNLSKYRPEVKVTTWLYTIVTNLCLDHLKSAYSKRQRLTDSFENQNGSVSSFMPEAELMHAELNALLAALAEGLTPKQKAVYILRDMEGLEMEEISVILEMSPGNVKSNLYYARIAISERLKKYYQERKPLSI